MNTVILILATTLFAEARSEGDTGLRHVASVIWNRAAEPKGRYDLAWVVLKPRQFACWNNRDTNDLAEPVLDNKADTMAWQECVWIAEEMVSGTFKPVTTADHYYNPNKVMPKWADSLRDVQDVGRHRFGRMK